MKFRVANVKCDGCAANIRDGLGNVEGVSQVSVDVASGDVEVHGDTLVRDVLITRLAESGYPPSSS
ncbi:MAG: heavy-metal-associated domain-containing protein [Gammaproteobacteria bacterium]|nr:heavy-metal-associated domain-containing protein [Gammaproteobacteria bacterium]